MTAARVVSSFLILVLAAAAPAPQPVPAAAPALPASAEAAKQQYAQSLDKAKADMDALVEKANKQFEETQLRLKTAYLQKLDQAIAAETKKGNLDGALALRAEKASVEGGAPGGTDAGTARSAISTKPGLIMIWDGSDKDGKPFPFARVAERIPVPMNKASRALPVKVPDATPAIFQGFARIQRDKEDMVLNAKASPYTQVKIVVDDEKILDLDNGAESREFTLQRGLHKISIRFSGEASASFQLTLKRTGAAFTDYVYDANDLAGKQIVK